MTTVRTVWWHSWLERQHSKQEVVGSSPAVGKNFKFCNYRSLHVPHSLTKPLRKISTVAYI